MRPTIRILEEALIGRILEEAKRVLATVGMEIRGPEMRRRLLEHGLPMDAAGVRVLFPRDVVDAALTSAPSSFVLYDRDGNQDLPTADDLALPVRARRWRPRRRGPSGTITRSCPSSQRPGRRWTSLGGPHVHTGRMARRTDRRPVDPLSARLSGTGHRSTDRVS